MQSLASEPPIRYSGIILLYCQVKDVVYFLLKWAEIQAWSLRFQCNNNNKSLIPDISVRTQS